MHLLNSMGCGYYGKITKKALYDRLPGDDRMSLDRHLGKCQTCLEAHEEMCFLSQAAQKRFQPSPHERLAGMRNWKLLPFKELNDVCLQEGLKPSIPPIGTDPFWYSGFLSVGTHSLSVTYAIHCDPKKEELVLLWGPRIRLYGKNQSRDISVLRLPAEEQARIERLDEKVRMLFQH